MVDIVPEKARKGRGAISNPVGRFEPAQRFATDDGWQAQSGDEGEDEDGAPPVRTTVMRDATRSVLNRNDSPDTGEILVANQPAPKLSELTGLRR